MVRFIFICVLTAGTLASCAPDQPQASAPQSPVSMYAIRDGVDVKSAEGVVVKKLQYGEEIQVVGDCLNAKCETSVNGQKAIVLKHGLTTSPPPSGERFADEDATATLDSGKAIQLRLNQKVMIKEYDKNRELVRIDYKDAWVRPSLLRDQKVSAEELNTRQQALKAAAKAAVEERREYAEQLRTHFLDNMQDIKVRVSGTSSNHLYLTYVLFGDVWTHQFQKGDLINEIRAKGFTQVDLDNNYDYHVRITL